MAEAKTTTKKAESTEKPKAAPKASKSASKDSSALMAVLATGGKQYAVKAGDTIKIEKLSDTHKVGDKVSFDSVLLTVDGTNLNIGKPFIKGGAVSGTVSKIGRNKTIDVIKYKQKSRYFKKYGHRQPFVEVKIDSIK